MDVVSLCGCVENLPSDDKNITINNNNNNVYSWKQDLQKC